MFQKADVTGVLRRCFPVIIIQAIGLFLFSASVIPFYFLLLTRQSEQKAVLIGTAVSFFILTPAERKQKDSIVKTVIDDVVHLQLLLSATSCSCTQLLVLHHFLLQTAVFIFHVHLFFRVHFV
jgi:hypothetical protein